ncbi:MAG: FAD-dependent oxidoreductase [Clostridia bacterium]|nr:FAD-dependent oxidoreductase [Clostridia bacterium]
MINCSDNGSAAPSYIREELMTPVTHRADVLVAGGGVAGIAAALAAARHGADVLLIEREFELGGLATLGLITYYLPLCDGCGHQVIYGIGEELLKTSIKFGAEKDYPSAWLDGGSPEEKTKQRFKAGYNGPLFMMETEFLLLKAGVRILYGTQICAAETRENRITHVICENKSGRFAVSVGRVIDATGDADVAAAAGAETALFSQGNILAGWYYYVAGGVRKLKVLGPSDIPDEEKAAGAKTKKPLVDRRFSGLDGDELSDMVMLSHRATYDDWKKNHDADPSYLPDAIPTIPQIRMTRRIIGTATPHSADDRVRVPDCIGVTGHWRKRGPVYELPFGALRSVNICNLLAAGRDISVTDAMWDNTRVIPTCAVTGEAAGTAAAMFNDFLTLSNSDIDRLRSELRRGGVRTSIEELAL